MLLATPGAAAVGEGEKAGGNRVRLAAALASLVVSAALLVAKYAAYRLTGSAAVLSDATESVVNVVAAVFALGAVFFSGRPADRSHPYGHGKVEFFSAVFEGGLISFAAFVVLYEAISGLVTGVEIRALNVGILIVVGAGIVNAVLGTVLVRTGRRTGSLTLVADGQHVLSDFWTSIGVAAGLGLVEATGILWLDPLVAAIVGAKLGWTGYRLVRHAAGGLLDEEDTDLLGHLVRAMNGASVPGVIRVHYLRAIRAGRFTHVDAHLVVPEFWSVERAHDAADSLEQHVIGTCPVEGEIIFHTDPCRQAYCTVCDVPACPVRREPFRSRPPISVDEAVMPDLRVRALQEAGRLPVP